MAARDRLPPLARETMTVRRASSQWMGRKIKRRRAASKLVNRASGGEIP